MNDLVLIQQDRPSVQIQDTATITVLDSPDIVRVENNANIIVSNSDLPVFVKYSTQKGEDGHTPTNEEITDLVTPEFLISKLTGQIKSTELYGDLASRIDKIAVLENSIYNLNNAVSLAVTETGVAAILEDYSTTVTTTSAIAQTRDGLLATMGNNIAASLSEYTVSADLDGAVATKVDTLIAATGNSLGDLSAALKVEQKVRAQTIAPLWVVNKEYQKGEAVLYNKIIYQCVTLAGANIGLVPSSNPTHWKLVEANLYAQYSIKTDVNGNVAGFGLANDGVTSDFTVLADRFSISAAADTTNTNVPFIVTGGKVYINSALIAAASITEAEIENGAITNAKIKDVIQSTVYTPGAGGTGWMIDKAGTIRGQGIIVEDGSITTAKIANAAIGTAQIGNAQVDTLQIKGYAVSVSAYIAASSLTFAVPPGTSASVLITVSGDNVWFEGDLWTSAYQELELKIDGTVVRKAKHPISQVILANNTGSEGEIPYVDKTPGGTVAYSHVATLSAGLHTVSIQTIGGVYPYYFVAGSPSISITMLMR